MLNVGQHPQKYKTSQTKVRARMIWPLTALPSRVVQKSTQVAEGSVMKSTIDLSIESSSNLLQLLH